MTFTLFQRVVLTQDLPDEGLRAGDVGVIVEHYPAREDIAEGHELEVFAAGGQTVAVVSVPATAVSEAGRHEVLSTRELTRTRPPCADRRDLFLGQQAPENGGRSGRDLGKPA